MTFPFKPLVIGMALFICGPAAAESSDRQVFQDTLAALGEPLTTLGKPLPLVATSCLPDTQQIQAQKPLISAFLLDQGRTPPYSIPFDDAASADLVKRVKTAAVAAGSSEYFEKTFVELEQLGATDVFSNAFKELGLTPDSIIDVTALYLVALWVAQEADFERLSSVEIIQAVRDQVALAELKCFQLGKEGDGLADVRNLLIARIGFLIDGLERSSQQGEATAFGTFVRETSGWQIKGLTLTATGFQ
jgi:hypothetical protein